MDNKNMEKIVYKGGSYEVLSAEEISQIHETTINVLEEVGFEISLPLALALLEKHGASIDWDKKRAFLTRELISKCIKQAPGEFTFYGREEGRSIILGGKRVHFGTGGKALYVLDLERNKRPSSINDVGNLARLADRLEYVDFFIIPVYAHDVHIDAVDSNSFYNAMKNTSKPVMGSIINKQGLEDVIEISSYLAGSMDKLKQKPFIGFIGSIASPLKVGSDQAEIIMEVARYNLPLAISTAPVAGATSPITLAGTLVQQNAEALIGVVLSQLVNPGAPVFYSAVPSTMDMQTASFLMGSVESGLMNAAISQMAHYYRIPCYITVGVTDSKVPDGQAAHESATTCMMAALAGGNFIHEAVGLLDGAMIASYAQYIIDNDIIGSCLRALRGVNINPDTLAFDVIKKVGPGGNFMANPHTIKYLRSESYLPRTSSRQNYQDWLKAGGKDSWKKAEELAGQMLKNENDSPSYIPGELDAKIRSVYPELL